MTTRSSEQSSNKKDIPAGGTRRRGRRSGGEDTRAALVAAARAVFAEQGYQGATVRAIAARAGVDAAMVNHWFGGKQGLFAAIVDLPFDPADLITTVLAGERDELAERVIRRFVPIWDAHEGAFAALMLSVASQEVAARMMGDFFTTTVFGRVAEAIGVDQPDVRASLCATQIIGLGLVRYVLKLQPLASADVDTVVAMVAPNLQRYLTGDIGTTR
jgi:AcrR family transcriptional regulator